MNLVVVALLAGVWAMIAVPRRRYGAGAVQASVHRRVDDSTDSSDQSEPVAPRAWTRGVQVRRRRLIVLTGLVAVAGVPGLMLGGAAWVPAAAALGGLLAYLGVLVRQGVRRSEARRKVLSLPQRPHPPEPAWPARAMAMQAEDPRRQSG